MDIGIRDIPAEPPRRNSREFFEFATLEDVAERLADGAEPDELDSDDRIRAPPKPGTWRPRW